MDTTHLQIKLFYLLPFIKHCQFFVVSVLVPLEAVGVCSSKYIPHMHTEMEFVCS